jgi:nitrile hydratase accessory protein
VVTDDKDPAFEVIAQRDPAEDEPPFADPWQARAFALTVALNEAGHLDWSEWTRLLGEELSKSDSTGTLSHGDDYYRCWVTALERASANLPAKPKRK